VLIPSNEEIKTMSSHRGLLTKNDAPLRIQYQKGHTAFIKGHMSSPFNSHTMQYREWLRGFNAAYFENLETLKSGKPNKTSR
jgi:hypothetical protein